MNLTQICWTLLLSVLGTVAAATGEVEIASTCLTGGAVIIALSKEKP